MVLRFLNLCLRAQWVNSTHGCITAKPVRFSDFTGSQIPVFAAELRFFLSMALGYTVYDILHYCYVAWLTQGDLVTTISVQADYSSPFEISVYSWPFCSLWFSKQNLWVRFERGFLRCREFDGYFSSSILSRKKFKKKLRKRISNMTTVAVFHRRKGNGSFVP